nr:hypothetical protein Iba_chr12dCG8630 [Ipomoea batatas]
MSFFNRSEVRLLSSERSLTPLLVRVTVESRKSRAPFTLTIPIMMLACCYRWKPERISTFHDLQSYGEHILLDPTSPAFHTGIPEEISALFTPSALSLPGLNFLLIDAVFGTHPHISNTGTGFDNFGTFLILFG